MLYLSFYGGICRGNPISISPKPPENFHGTHLAFFAPSEKILLNWESSKKTPIIWNEIFAPAYKRLLQQRWAQIQDWLNFVDPIFDQTLLSAEKPQQFSYRQIVGDILHQLRPDCFAGEIANSSLEQVKNNAEIETSKYLTTIPTEGQIVEIFCPGIKDWVRGCVEETYFPPRSKKYSYITVRAKSPFFGDRLLKAYHLQQLRHP